MVGEKVGYAKWDQASKSRLHGSLRVRSAQVLGEGAPGNTTDVAADIGYGTGPVGHEVADAGQLFGSISARIGERLAKQLPYLAVRKCTLALFGHRSLKLLFGQATKAFSKADNLPG